VDGPRLREPEQIRQECAAKFRPVIGSGVAFAAILGYLLREDWGEPRIDDMVVSDECIFARAIGQESHSLFVGARECLIRQIRYIASRMRWTWTGTNWDTCWRRLRGSRGWGNGRV